MTDAPGRQSSLRWWVLFASTVSLALSPGPMVFASMGLFAPHLSEVFGWSRGGVMLGLTLFNIGGLVASPLTGRLMDRWGPRALILPSLIFLSAGFAGLAYLVSDIYTYYAVAFVWGALTIATQSISYAHLLVGWFPERRGMAIGIAASGLGLGYMIMPVTVQAMLTHMTWQQVMLTLGAAIIIGPGLLNIMFARPSPRRVTVDGKVDVDGLTLAEVRRTRAFWLIASAIFLMAAVLTGILPHIVIIAGDAGASLASAALIASIYGAATLVGRLVVGLLVDRFPAALIGMIFFGMAGIGCVLLAVASSGAGGALLLSLAIITIGLGFGAESDLIAIFIARYFGQRAFGAVYGYLLSAFILGSALGAPALGFGRDAFGGYGGLLLAAAGVTAVAVFCLSQLQPKWLYKAEDRGVPLPKAMVNEA